jgi:hypothetical protein
LISLQESLFAGGTIAKPSVSVFSTGPFAAGEY